MKVELVTNLKGQATKILADLHVSKEPILITEQGQHTISINDQWHICFRFEDGDAYEVEVRGYH